MLNRIWKTLILVLAAGVLVTSLYFQVSSRDNIESASLLDELVVGIKVGEIAPDFNGIMLDREAIRLSDFRGKVVLLNDFASWCDPASQRHLILWMYQRRRG